MHVWEQAAQGQAHSAAMFLSVCSGNVISLLPSLSLSPLPMSHTHTHTPCCDIMSHICTRGSEGNTAPAEASSSSWPGCSCPCSALQPPNTQTNKQTNAHGHVLSVALAPSAHRGVLRPDDDRWALLSSMGVNIPALGHG